MEETISKWICCYCGGHIFEEKKEQPEHGVNKPECPQCGYKLPVEGLEHWKQRIGKEPSEVWGENQ